MNKAEIEKEIEVTKKMIKPESQIGKINFIILQARLSQRIDDEKEFKERIEKMKKSFIFSRINEVYPRTYEELIKEVEELLSSLDNGGMK